MKNISISIFPLIALVIAHPALTATANSTLGTTCAFGGISHTVVFSNKPSGHCELKNCFGKRAIYTRRRERKSFSKNVNSVSNILSIRTPFQILNTVVVSYSVDVVDLGFVVGVWNKRFSHKAMDCNHLFALINLQTGVVVSERDSRNKNLFFRDISARFAMYKSGERFDSSSIADLVKPFISFYRFPNFIHNCHLIEQHPPLGVTPETRGVPKVLCLAASPTKEEGMI